jgi:hypothetical protein
MLVSNFLQAQDTTLLIAGPMLGYVEHREALIWLEVSSAVSKIQLNYYKKENSSVVKTFNYKGELGAIYNPVKLVIDNLEMNTQYLYEILLNGKKQSFPYQLSLKQKTFGNTGDQLLISVSSSVPVITSMIPLLIGPGKCMAAVRESSTP